MEKLRIMSVFGTRPEAIKMCPLVRELASRPEIESLCAVSQPSTVKCSTVCWRSLTASRIGTSTS